MTKRKRKIEVNCQNVLCFVGLGLIVGVIVVCSYVVGDVVVKDPETGKISGFILWKIGVLFALLSVLCGVGGVMLNKLGVVELREDLRRKTWWQLAIYGVSGPILMVLGLALGLHLEKWLYLAGIVGFMFLVGYSAPVVGNSETFDAYWGALDSLGETLAYGPMSGLIMLLFGCAIFGSMVRVMGERLISLMKGIRSLFHFGSGRRKIHESTV